MNISMYFTTIVANIYMGLLDFQFPGHFMFCLVLKCTRDNFFSFLFSLPFPDVFGEETKNERLSGKITRNLGSEPEKGTNSIFLVGTFVVG
jgi:hypothetical protein